MDDQLSPFSQLIGRSCDHHFVHLFGKSVITFYEWKDIKLQVPKKSGTE